MTGLDVWRATGREVSVAGIGKSGVAATRLLRRHAIPVYLSDSASNEKSRDAADELLGEFGAEGLVIEAGGHDLARIARSQALILSPGIPPEAPVVRGAIAAAVPVLAEAQLGFDALGELPYLAVTGTNGKTTTTALTDHLLRIGGRRSIAAGNIGHPICSVALQEIKPDWVVAELSSFQLHDCPDLHPVVGILTNLAPDHLDRYSNVAEYYADKERMFANATLRSIWVSNLDDPDSREMMGRVNGRHLSFSVMEGVRSDGWYDHAARQLMLAGQPLLARTELHLLGDHNIANALAAALALHAIGVPIEALAEGLRTFHPLTHRLEPIREVDGVLWINDSKATNVASTEVAVRGMTRPFVLLLGGRHKGQPYSSLIEPLRAHAVAVVAYGEAGELIERDLGSAIPVVRGGDFRNVIERARTLAPEGGAVLLSPACSSFDMFTGYDARGAMFRAMVEAM